MKQSSIEWLVSILNKTGFAPVLTDEEINQAKEMHKQEIIEAHNKGVKDGINYHIDSEWGYDTICISADDYYKNTYEKEQN